MISRTLNTNITSIKFKNEHIVYENFIKCTVKDYEFNLSYNPTLLSGSQGVMIPFSSSIGGDVFYINTGSNYGILKDIYTSSISGSEFSPYVSAVGLYNDSNDLLAIAKMAAPMPLSSNTDVTFLVKWDTKWDPRPYFTPSMTPTISPTSTPTPTPPPPSLTSTPTVTKTPSVTPTVTPSIEACDMTGFLLYPDIPPSHTPTPTITRTPTPTPSLCCGSPIIGQPIINNNPDTQTATINYYNGTGCGTCSTMEYRLTYSDSTTSAWISLPACDGTFTVPYDPLDVYPTAIALKRICVGGATNTNSSTIPFPNGTSTWRISKPTFMNSNVGGLCVPGFPSEFSVCCPADISSITINANSYTGVSSCGTERTITNPSGIAYYTSNNSIMLNLSTLGGYEVYIRVLRNGVELPDPVSRCYSYTPFITVNGIYVEPDDDITVLLVCCQTSSGLCS